MSTQPGAEMAEAEAAKAAKIAEVAHLCVSHALDVTPQEALRFVRYYFRHTDATEMLSRSSSELAALVKGHFDLAQDRTRGAANVTVCEAADHGMGARGTIVIQLVTDDTPFIVDSITMELTRQEWGIVEVFHPQFQVVRDADGRFVTIVSRADAGHKGAHGESWVCLEVSAPSGAAAQGLLAGLEASVRTVLAQVQAVVEDWQQMRNKALALLDVIRDAPAPVLPHQREANAALLTWLAEGHFTFLGYREYAVEGSKYRPVPGGLGILRDDEAATVTFHARPIDDAPAQLVLTKDSRRATVHRPTYQDYVGIRLFDDRGRLTGEHRFLGLLSASAYTDTVDSIPVLRSKAQAIMDHIGFAPDSHGGKAVRQALAAYPRDELFQGSVAELAPVIEAIAGMKERRKVRLFVRRGLYGRFLSCLVFLPRDRYTTEVRRRLQDELMESLGGESLEYQARVSESVLARLFFVVKMPEGRELGEVDVPMLEKKLTNAIRCWDDDFMDEAALLPSKEQGVEYPEAYKDDFRPHQGIQDLAALNQLSAKHPMSFALYAPDDPDDPAHLRLKVFSSSRDITLSGVMPHLSHLGVTVVDERPYGIELRGTQPMIYDFGLAVPGGTDALEADWSAADRLRFTDAFEASFSGRTEVDGLSALVTRAKLTWQEVAWLRAISRYMQQTGTSFGQDYIAQAMLAHPDLAAMLVRVFRIKFDPGSDLAQADRPAAVGEVAADLQERLEHVESLDHDRIIRGFLDILQATVRTNAFQPGDGALALKLLPRELDFLPEPRPVYEIFVQSPRVAGVHLRFGKVARGGLRWSDRRDDFRTEILGLVKAQMVKNTVIVPVGAKGGFYPKHLPNPAQDRQGWLEEGMSCYRAFVTALLSVTDNIVGGEVVGPENVIRYDGDDAYLVVAADKGTATFSDLANEIAVGRGFWLGDAFASGGSVGYDHKGMGITARGAWESVRRHFFEMGLDPESEDFTCVGIGDMSGDVFGNGMLQSKHTRLIAAFNHLHIFVDPDPDPDVSWTERQRLFGKARSTWADYAPELISDGGGVFARTLKAIPVSPQMRRVLGLEASVTELTSAGLIQAILRAPVDLLWNGGIGTYVKAGSETHAQVADKANDALRINGADLRARCVVEGGNLGLTPLGRIEYAAAGGRINTDFIDNSAGVDTSDHEVNIKILLAGEVAAGRLTAEERDAMLPLMTEDIAALVLRHNVAQNRTLANAQSRAAAMAGAHEDWMTSLEKSGYLDRKVQFMPSTAEMRRRIGERQGLTNPELCTLLAWTKIKLEDDVLASDLPDDPYLADALVDYFPPLLRDRYADVMPAHRLHREIITTVAVNNFVDEQGISAFFRLSEETGAGVADIFRAQMTARGVFRADEHEEAVGAEFDAEVQTALRVELRLMVEKATRWLLQNQRGPLDVQATIDQFGPSVRQIKDKMDGLLAGGASARFRARLQDYLALGVPEALASVVAGAPFLTTALAVAKTAQVARRPLMTVARTYFALGERLSLDLLLTKVEALPRMNRWDTMARSALRDELLAMHAQLARAALEAVPDTDDGDAVVAQWWETVPAVGQRAQTLQEICEGQVALSRLSVAMRTVRMLLAGLP